MEVTETGAAACQIWEAPTASDMGGSVKTVHDAQRCSF